MKNPNWFFFFKMKSFRRDRRGGVALIFGLSVIPVMALLALAVDFSRAISAKQAAIAAADAAALTAGAVAQQELIAGKATWNSDAISAGQNQFLAQGKLNSSVTVTTPGIAINPSSQGYAVTVNYSGSYQTVLMSAPLGLLTGVSGIPFSGSVQASFMLGSAALIAPYTDVHIVIDNPRQWASVRPLQTRP